MTFHQNMSRIGVHFADDGATVTLTPALLAPVFGRGDGVEDFEVTLRTTDLGRLRGLLLDGHGELHVRVSTRFTTEHDGERHGTRIIAQAHTKWRPLTVDATYWWTSQDGDRSELRSQVLLDLSRQDASHFWQVDTMLRGGGIPPH